MSELKPCPFCGGEPVLKQYRADGLEIKCSSCHSGRQQRWLHKGKDWLEEKMIEKWNERAAPVVERQDDHVGTIRHVVTDTGERYEGVIRAGAILEGLVENGTKLYASPPAPVSVVLPDRKPIEDLLFNWTTEDVENTGWNACLDKVKELNQ